MSRGNGTYPRVVAPNGATLLPLIGTASILCLDVAKQGWDDARGYSCDDANSHAALRCRSEVSGWRDQQRYEVASKSQPPLIVTGRRSPATDVDVRRRLQLMLSNGWQEETARYALFNRPLRDATSQQLQARCRFGA